MKFITLQNKRINLSNVLFYEPFDTKNDGKESFCIMVEGTTSTFYLRYCNPTQRDSDLGALDFRINGI